MRVNLIVDEIVLEGIPISPADTPLVQQAVERRLAEVLGTSQQAEFPTAFRRQTEIRVGPLIDPVIFGRDLANGLLCDHSAQAPIAENTAT